MPSLNAKNKPKNTAAESIAENNIYLEAVAPTNTPSSKKAATDTKGKVFHGCRNRCAVIGKQRKEACTACSISQSKHRSGNSTHGSDHIHHLPESPQVARTYISPRQRFSRESNSVTYIRKDYEQLNEQRICRKNRGIHSRTADSEPRHYGNVQKRAQKYIPVHVKELSKRRTVHDFRQFHSRQSCMVFGTKYNKAERKPHVFSRHRSRSHALHFPLQRIHKQQTRHEICHILHYSHTHGSHRVLHSEKPTRERINSEHCRRTENADSEISNGRCFDIGGTINKSKNRTAQPGA